MANCFGEVVDNYKLDEMERYIGKPKTQEDRAREAMNLINEDGKNDKAAQYAQSVKDYYGSGVSTLCLIYNATGETVKYVADYDWWGNISRTPYPTEIGNGQWAAFQHVHKTGDASGSEAAVVYRAKNKDGDDRDLLVGWSTPWSTFYHNSCYCEVGVVDHFQGIWKWIYEKLNDAGYSSTSDDKGSIIQADTATGGAPVFKATMSIAYSP